MGLGLGLGCGAHLLTAACECLCEGDILLGQYECERHQVEGPASRVAALRVG